MTCQLVSCGSYLEPKIGFSRAVRIGNTVSVAAGDGTEAPDDVYGQTLRRLATIRTALEEAGASLDDDIRIRVMLTDITRWQEAGRPRPCRGLRRHPPCLHLRRGLRLRGPGLAGRPGRRRRPRLSRLNRDTPPTCSFSV